MAAQCSRAGHPGWRASRTVGHSTHEPDRGARGRAGPRLPPPTARAVARRARPHRQLPDRPRRDARGGAPGRAAPAPDPALVPRPRGGGPGAGRGLPPPEPAAGLARRLLAPPTLRPPASIARSLALGRREDRPDRWGPGPGRGRG